MFGDKPSFYHPTPPRSVQPVAVPVAYGRSARRAQIIILVASLTAVFMLAAVASFFQPEAEPGRPVATIVEEDEQQPEDDNETEEPKKTSKAVFNRQESFVGDGSTFIFQLDETPRTTSGDETPVEVLVNGLNAAAQLQNRTVTLESPPADGAEIKISYIAAEVSTEVSQAAGEPEPPESEEPEEPVLVIKEIPAIPAHPQPPVVNIEYTPVPAEPEPPINPGEEIPAIPADPQPPVVNIEYTPVPTESGAAH